MPSADPLAASFEPNNYFMYPDMGTHLERDVRYVNVNAANHRLAIQYPACQPRVDPDPDAWLANLNKAQVRWLLVNRYVPFPYPLEADWAAARPDLFALRFEDKDDVNRVYEVLPAARSAVGP